MKLTPEMRKKWLLNGLKFVAPTLAIFFYQLSKGVDIKASYLLALYALYQSLSDLFSKISKD